MIRALAAESARLAALRRYELLDTAAEPQFDALARLAAHVCATPMALVSLVDERRHFFKARFGIDQLETPRAGSFCSQAILRDQLFVVPDARSDQRFASHEMVVGAPGLRFYAAAPLITAERAAVGTLCVLGTEPRELSSTQGEALAALAGQTVALLEARRVLQASRALRSAIEHPLRAALDEVARSSAVVLKAGAGRAGAAAMARSFESIETARALADDLAELAALAAEGGRALVLGQGDLGQVCAGIADALGDSQPGRRLLAQAEGDCAGSWDVARLGIALGIVAEDALTQARQGTALFLCAAAAGDHVLVELRDLSGDRTLLEQATGGLAVARDPARALRLQLARQILLAHGARIELTGGMREGFRLAVCLPR